MRSWRVFTFALIASFAFSVLTPALALADDGPTNKGVDLRYHPHSSDVALADVHSVSSGTTSGSSLEAGDNIQVNDPALDNVQTFAGTRPFEKSIQSETSIARFGTNIVVGYNSSADQPVVQIDGSLFFTHRHFSGYSVSHDGGQTWTSGFVPPNTGSPFTFGDPSVGVDRKGNFYYASLGTLPLVIKAGRPFFEGAIIVNKSTDGGSTFAPAVVAAVDDGSDKEWLAVGRDPFNEKQDNIYLAWTSFQPPLAPVRSELRFARSTDGGATWTSKTLFAPVRTGVLSAFIQFANPVVDPENGRLYIPFLHFGRFDADFIKVLVSDDAGATFKFLEFNVPGAPDNFGFPNVTPGTLSDCGSPGGGIRLVLRQGANLGGVRFGLPRFRQSTRIITQPSAVAADGDKLFIAFNTSTSPSFGDGSGSFIRLLFSRDGGKTFTVSTVAQATAAEPQHVHPAVTVDEDRQHVRVAYYTQLANGRLRVDVARGDVKGKRVEFEADDIQPVSSATFDMIPSNNPIPVVAANIEIAKPTGTVSGHVMVAAITVRGGDAVTVTAPAGWSLVRRTDNGDLVGLAVYRKVAGAVEPPSYTWKFTSAVGAALPTKAAGGIQTYSGVDTTTPIDAESGQVTSNAVTHTAPSVTTTVSNTRVVTFHSARPEVFATWTPPLGMSERVDRQDDRVALEGNDVAQAGIGATGPKTATITVAGPGATQTLALRPAGSTTPAFRAAASAVAGLPFRTTNYDRTVVACYNIGEYLSITTDDSDSVLAAWGDNRNTWTPPTHDVPSPANFTHAQSDVFFAEVED